ncbi:MAG TPA: hypothetical protein VMQ58_01985 [Candidatus Saccharimonadales bacterium]|nr:hypothetical protein [Candidatus Saccharimonadales bacterium]
MIDITTATLMFTISIGFLVVGLVFGKQAYILTLFGGVMMIVTGVIILSSPIQFKTGSVITYDYATNTNVVTNTYSNINSNFNYFLSLVSILLGLFGFLGSIFLINGYQESKRKDYADSFE